VTDYELGWKDTFLDGRLRLQLDGYHYDYKNFQVSIFDPGNALGVIRNVSGTTTLEGVEAQGAGVFGDFSIDFTASYNHSKLGAFSAIDPRRAAAGLRNLTGREQPNAPPWTVSIGGQYTFHVTDGDTLTPRVDYGMVGARWATLFQVSPTDRLSEQNIVNAQLTYARSDNWRVIAYATNLFDQHYISSLSLGSLASAGPPRQYGLRISKSF
jgi:iron complex outermembrane receptor protein